MKNRTIVHDHLTVTREHRSQRRREFDRAYAEFGPGVREYLRSILRDPEECEEAVQDTWVAFYGLLEREEPRRTRPLLLTIARRCGLDRLRRRQRKAGVQPLKDDESPPPRDGTLEEMMRECIERLPLELREVFVMRHRMRLSYAEMAECLRVPEGTIASRLHAALRKMRSLLDDEGLSRPRGESA